MSRLVSFVVLIAIIIVVGFLVYRVLANFMPPLFLACLLVVIFRPLHHWILGKVRQRNRLAAGLTTVAVVLAVLLPAIGVFTIAAFEGADLVAHLSSNSIRGQLETLRKRMGLELPGANELRDMEESLTALMVASMHGEKTVQQQEMVIRNNVQRVERVRSKLLETGKYQVEETEEMVQPLAESLKQVEETEPGKLENEAAIQDTLREIRELELQVLGGGFNLWAAEIANPSDQRLREINGAIFSYAQRSAVSATGNVTGALAGYIIGLVIMVVSIYFFFADGPKMIHTLMNLFPLDDRYEQELLLEFDNVSRAVVLSHLVSALAQALLAGIAFYFAGLDAVFLLMLLTFTLAMVPFVGAASVWVPCALYLFFIEDRMVAAILLALWGGLVVSTIDNIIKPYILHGRSKLHPLLALLSVLGGVQALGPIGILIGPMVVVFLSTLLKILHREMTHLEGHSWSKLVGAPTEPKAP